MTSITLVLALSDNGVIGDQNTIPWRIKEDMRRFKQLTLAKPNIMGRKTWESLPKKPLPGRSNIVVTRNKAYQAEGAKIATSLEHALDIARAETTDEIMIIGGADLYWAALPLATHIQLTEVHADIKGDTHFTFDRTGWAETARSRHQTDEGLAYSYVTLEKI